MQDPSKQNEYILELIAKSLDEPLTAREQQQVEQAMRESLALQLVAQTLYEFDALLRRTGMAIPDEGFPARVLARLELYEKRRSRLEWLITLGLIFLGLLAAVVWLAIDLPLFVHSAVQWIQALAVLVPVSLHVLFVLTAAVGSGTLVVYAIFVLVLMLFWARVSGAFVRIPVQR